jgi:hypothetical protein
VVGAGGIGTEVGRLCAALGIAGCRHPPTAAAGRASARDLGSHRGARSPGSKRSSVTFRAGRPADPKLFSPAPCLSCATARTLGLPSVAGEMAASSGFPDQPNNFPDGPI